MKINKIFSSISKHNYEQCNRVPNYNPKDVTIKEFREFVHYLAKNKINRTFVEPKKFVTEAERTESKIFRNRIRFLAENKINQIFYC